MAKVKPHRIQRKRTKGWRMPANTVYVGRPSNWGNVWPVYPMSPSPARDADAYRRWLLGKSARSISREYVGDADVRGRSKPPSLKEIRAKLRGKNLACWCPLDQPCHADVLLELANRPEREPFDVAQAKGYCVGSCAKPTTLP